LIVLLVLLLLRAHGSFVSQFAAGEADDWEERKIRLRCRQLSRMAFLSSNSSLILGLVLLTWVCFFLFPDLLARASETLVSILLALVTLDLAFLRGAFSFGV